jgi:hypothetical protein
MGIVVRLCALALVVPSLGGNDCRPAQPAGPSGVEPQLTDARGDPDSGGFAQLVESVERTRRLHFVRWPMLVVMDPSAPELAALERQTRALLPLPDGERPRSLGEAQGKATETGDATPALAAAAFPDFERAEIVASPPLRIEALRRALGRLIDGENYPRLVEAAPRVPGDGGIALRALLAVSADATAAGSWFPGGLHLPEAQAPLTAPRIEGLFGGKPAFDVATGPLQSAGFFLLSLDDPERAFRSPPLSTKQLLSPPAYLASDRPIRLIGVPPPFPHCNVRDDASLGVLRLLIGLSRSGASVAGESLARWKGDRLVRLSCEDGRAPWIYVAEFAGDVPPRDFEARIDALLPGDLTRPLQSVKLARRIAAWSGLEAETATVFARTLGSREVKDWSEWLP